MLELIAQVDPMTLPLWAVLAFSAAMYPLGFMLGAPCSDCCQGCGPCNKCNLYYDGENGIRCFIDGTGSELDLSVSLGSYGTCEFTSVNVEPNCEQAIPIDDLPEFTLTCYDLGYASAQPAKIYIKSVYNFPTTDECGCETCGWELSICIDINLSESSSTVRICCDWIANAGSCASSAADFTNYGCLLETFDFYPLSNGCTQAEVDSFLASLQSFADTVFSSVTASITYPSCDCGACCDNGCEENVAEGGCTAWQGVGTDCDPDPCV